MRQLWLSVHKWMARALCKHTHGFLLSIEFDGSSVYECAKCGKRFVRTLS